MPLVCGGIDGRGGVAGEGGVKVNPPSLWVLRISCPLVLVSAIALAVLCYQRGMYFYMAVNCVIVGTNAVMSYVQWFLLQPKVNDNV